MSQDTSLPSFMAYMKNLVDMIAYDPCRKFDPATVAAAQRIVQADNPSGGGPGFDQPFKILLQHKDDLQIILRDTDIQAITGPNFLGATSQYTQALASFFATWGTPNDWRSVPDNKRDALKEKLAKPATDLDRDSVEPLDKQMREDIRNGTAQYPLMSDALLNAVIDARQVGGEAEALRLKTRTDACKMTMNHDEHNDPILLATPRLASPKGIA